MRDKRPRQGPATSGLQTGLTLDLLPRDLARLPLNRYLQATARCHA